MMQQINGSEIQRLRDKSDGLSTKIDLHLKKLMRSPKKLKALRSKLKNLKQRA